MAGVRSVLLPWRLGASQPSLEGSVAWVVGGVGVVGSGICRGLLRAGATVIVNSRNMDRLEGLSNSLGNPERLVTVNGSMLADGAAKTVETVMQRCGKLDHVVAHSSVRWWALESGDDGAMEGELPDPSQKLLEVEPSKFEAAAYKSASLHYGAAFHLLPLMTGGGSYTFVTGGSRSLAWGPRGALGQLNTHAVRGLAAALRLDQESRGEAGHSHVDVQELRVGLAFEGQKAALQQVDDASRGLSGFKLDPRREEPLSQGIGTLCAGILANTAVQPSSPAEPRPPFDAAADALPDNLRPRPNLLVVSSQDDLASLRKAFPAKDEDFGRFFAPEL